MTVAGSTSQGDIDEYPTITISAITTIALSAMGSSMVPILVTCFQLRARWPSIQSVSAAPMNRTSANQSA